MSQQLTDFNGLNALITGASSGIGRIIAKRLAAGGAQVVLVARSREPLDELATEIRTSGGSALIMPCDVSELSQVKQVVAQVLAECGCIDILINNAGYGRHLTFLEWDIEDQERMMKVNYMGMMYFTKLLLPKMVEQGRGWIVFMASVAGKIATPEESAYAATKFATVGLAEALSIEVEDKGVHVLTVCPGAINTPFFDEEALRRMPPVSRDHLADPEKLVDAIFKALAKGKREVTYPYGIATAYIVRALAPGFMRKQVRRVTLDAIAKMKSSA